MSNKKKIEARIKEFEEVKQNQLDNGWVKSAEMTQKSIDALKTHLDEKRESGTS